ncbi:MAG TPA: AAA family ATPase [Kofleriaceae bacterium]|nr:AAA family ATPase [Kofleriaceae bacterium]
MPSGRLVIREFAQIREASIAFRDLTVLVGAQGTGKSLVLQWLKAAIDGKYIVQTLREAGQEVSRKTLIDLIFGVGMRSAWRDTSQIQFDGKEVTPATIERRGDGVERLFFIPAHRSSLISDGWATPFQKLTPETPVVARLFSQNLFERFNAREGSKLFPLDRLLKKVYRELINDAVFHGGTIGVEQNEQLAKRLRLRFEGTGDTSLPFMTWTAGQREFTPLLLGLYHLLPPRKKKKDDNIDWVVIEEPEMGLHPHAVTVVMLLVLDLLWRGYRVVLSTHSPIVVTAVWALQRLADHSASYQLVCDAFSVPTQYRTSLYAVVTAALTKTFATYALKYEDGQTTAIDISSLDPGADDDAVSGWGGLAGFSSRFGESVRKAANSAPGRAA